MIQVRKSEQRGRADHGWLKTNFSFSFADYYDPEFMGYRVLRVINDDQIAGGRGFPTHPHRDMEIITYVVEGAIEHRDTLGTSSVIRPGEVQRMSAGTGIQHSEFNFEKTATTRLLQIWIVPDKTGYRPGYQQTSFAQRLVAEDLVLVASNKGDKGSVSLNQDVNLYAAKWSEAKSCEFSFVPGRHGWIQIVNGTLETAGQALGAGDGAAFASESQITLRSSGPVEFLLFDLP